MTVPLSVRQLRLLAAIDAYRRVHGYPPSWRDLAACIPAANGLPASTSVVEYNLSQLRSHGLVEWEYRIVRSPRITAAGRRVLAGEQEVGA